MHALVHARTGVLSLLLLASAGPLSAGVALLIGEPFGRFGSFTPTGHAAIYLSGVCAETPTTLRLCQPGETGVVISRYNRIAGYDWIAVPLLPYLYGVDQPEHVLASADARAVAQVRDNYRRSHLQGVAPDGTEGETPKGEWIQLVGSAYDRSIYGVALETTPKDDERLIQYLNSQRNRRRFNFIYRNCADFARGIFNFYYPRALRRSVIADAGISTPKHAAKSLIRYCRRRPDLRVSLFVVPQIPGGRSSTKIRGVSETLIRTKKYVAPLVFLQPWVAATAAVAYLTSGRFDPARQRLTVCEPDAIGACMGSADVGVQLPAESSASRSYSSGAPGGGFEAVAVGTSR